MGTEAQPTKLEARTAAMKIFFMNNSLFICDLNRAINYNEARQRAPEVQRHYAGKMQIKGAKLS
jgi:hypothetical protein